MRRIFLLLVFAGGVVHHAGAAPPSDPLNSPMWPDMVRLLMPDAPVVFDERVKVIVPTVIENQAQVPVTVDARALPGVTKLIVFADLNPLQHVLTLTPDKAAPYISFRMKVEQSTPIRAAALAADGTWHTGGVFLDAAGGGCSDPATARKDADWSHSVGQVQGRLWRHVDGYTRVRLRVRHPMDTGLARDNTPAYFIEKLEMRTTSGAPLATLEMFEPVSEDPTVTLMLRLPIEASTLDIDGRDNNGRTYRSKLSANGRASALRVAARSQC